MATIKLQGNSSGSGSVTLVAPNTNATRTITLPDQDGSLGGAGSTTAWVNFNGYGTVSIRADGNVSSITDNGSGAYTVNFSSAIIDANFAAYGGAGWTSTDPFRDTGFNFTTTTSVKTTTFYGTSTVADAQLVMIGVTR